MRVTITKLRRDLFRLVEQTMEGESLEFTHKGVVFKIMPEQKLSKLSNLTARNLTPDGVDHENFSMLEEMQAEWEKDWAEL